MPSWAASSPGCCAASRGEPDSEVVYTVLDLLEELVAVAADVDQGAAALNGALGGALELGGLGLAAGEEEADARPAAPIPDLDRVATAQSRVELVLVGEAVQCRGSLVVGVGPLLGAAAARDGEGQCEGRNKDRLHAAAG